MAADAGQDDAYRAVGRWFVEFSRMVFHMRLLSEQRLTGSDDPMLAKLALGEMTADQVANSFFAMCEHSTDLDEEEQKIATRLRKEVKDETKRRNDFAHGDWWIGFGRKEDGSEDDPTLWRTKPMRKAGALERIELPVREIDELSERIHALRQKVAEFGEICLHE